MKKLIATVAIAIAPAGFVGPTGAMAATSNTWTAPGHTNYIGANTRPIIGAV